MKTLSCLLLIAVNAFLIEPAVAQSALGGPSKQYPTMGGATSQPNPVVTQPKGSRVVTSMVATKPLVSPKNKKE